MPGKNRSSCIAIAILTLLISTHLRADELVIVSPDGPLPRIVAAEGKIHEDAAADLVVASTTARTNPTPTPSVRRTGRS